jgi:CxxC-x17-CxxC domain-containing protein
MSPQEKSLTCFDCGEAYTFSVEEQQEYQAKGYINAPKRCPSCRQARKTRQMSSGSNRLVRPGFRPERQLFQATCAQCGQSAQVPFKPVEGRPVYCRDCYNTAKAGR